MVSGSIVWLLHLDRANANPFVHLVMAGGSLEETWQPFAIRVSVRLLGGPQKQRERDARVHTHTHTHPPTHPPTHPRTHARTRALTLTLTRTHTHAFMCNLFGNIAPENATPEALVWAGGCRVAQAPQSDMIHRYGVPGLLKKSPFCNNLKHVVFSTPKYSWKPPFTSCNVQVYNVRIPVYLVAS